MFVVPVKGRYRIVARMAAAASRAHVGIEFTADDAQADDRLPALRILDRPADTPYEADRRGGVNISSYQSERISRYAGIDQPTYLVLCALLGLTQWRALHDNDVIIPEDFIHDHGRTCLFSRCPMTLFPLLLENPAICSGCIQFYHALGADRELVSLLDAVHYAAKQQADDADA